jgi:hypothetical protein
MSIKNLLLNVPEKTKENCITPLENLGRQNKGKTILGCHAAVRSKIFIPVEMIFFRIINILKSLI